MTNQRNHSPAAVCLALSICFCLICLAGCRQAPPQPEAVENNSVETPPAVVLPDLDDYDAAEPLTADEFVLYNGVRLGMIYEEVLAIIGEDALTEQCLFYLITVPEYRYLDLEGIFYTFLQNDRDSFYLESVNFGEEATGAIFRNIKIGDTMESVFDKFPVRDRELKKWAWQMLYGQMPSDNNDGKNYSALEFVADSFYSMRFITDSHFASIAFSRLEQKVKWATLEYTLW